MQINQIINEPVQIVFHSISNGLTASLLLLLAQTIAKIIDIFKKCFPNNMSLKYKLIKVKNKNLIKS